MPSRPPRQADNPAPRALVRGPVPHPADDHSLVNVNLCILMSPPKCGLVTQLWAILNALGRLEAPTIDMDVPADPWRTHIACCTGTVRAYVAAPSMSALVDHVLAAAAPRLLTTPLTKASLAAAPSPAQCVAK